MSFLLRKVEDVTTISKSQSLTLVSIKDCTLRVPNKYYYMISLWAITKAIFTSQGWEEKRGMQGPLKRGDIQPLWCSLQPRLRSYFETRPLTYDLRRHSLMLPDRWPEWSQEWEKKRGCQAWQYTAPLTLSAAKIEILLWNQITQLSLEIRPPAQTTVNELRNRIASEHACNKK